MIKIALIFHSSSNDNMGVGALTVSEVEILRRIARDLNLAVSIVIVDSFSERPSYVSGSDVIVKPTRPLRKPWDFFRVVLSTDLVIDIGGGDSFSDIYGRRRIFQMLLMKFLVHLSGRPLVLAPQTFGPFESRFTRFLASISIRLCAIVATRDRLSLEFLNKIGGISSVVDSSDVALCLPYSAKLSRGQDRPIRVGVNVSGLLMSGGYTRDNMFRLKLDYAQTIREVISGFVGNSLGCEVHLVPHVISWNSEDLEDDYSASILLAEEFSGVKVAPAFSNPSEAKSYIAGLDFFVGARMHACIAAFSTGVPVVPMAYSRKFAGLFGSLGYHETVDCTSLSANEVVAKVFDAFERREQLRASQEAAFALGLGKLSNYEDRLRALVQDVSRVL